MIERAFIKTAYGQVHYRECGDGPPLLLLHQTADSSRAFEAVLPGLGAKRRVIALDTPGYGDSDPPPRQYSLADYAAAVAAFLDALGIQITPVLGNHTGAAIAVELAAGHPDRVEALIAVGIPFWDAAEREELGKRYLVPFRVAEDGSHLMQAWNKVRSRPSQPPLELIQRSVVDMLKAPDPIAAYRAVFAYEMAPRLPLVRCPALIMAGEHDMLAKCSEPAAALVPDARTLTFPSIGGDVIDQRSDEFVRTVLEFLASGQ